MKVGTADIIEKVDPPKKKRHGGRLGGTGTGSNGGGRNPGGGGGDGPSPDDKRDLDRFLPDKSKVLAVFLLLAIVMTFGGLMAAYIVLATNGASEWQPFSLPIQVWVSTALILAASGSYHLGKTAIDRNDQLSAKKWLIATTVLGAAFISSQILAWFELAGRGLYMRGNPYAGFFYILTAVHAVHVLGGIAALGAILLKNLKPAIGDEEILKRRTLAQVVGWYWHFMGGLWIVLFVLLGFWR